MNCRPELDSLIYVDGELPAAEVPAFEAHLATCVTCRRRVAALSEESTLIGEVLHEPAPATAQHAVSGVRGWLWAAVSLTATAVGVQAGLDVLAQLNTALGWLSPFSGLHPLSLLFGLVSLLTQEDVPMLFTSLATLMTGLLAFVSFSLVTRRRFVLASALLVLLVAAAPGHATEFRTQHDKSGIVVIPAGETIDDTVIVLGQSIVVEGTVTGDLIAVAESVRIPGEVRGSLVTLSKSLSIDGVVKGDLYSATQSLDLRGSVERNVHAAAETFDVASSARIARDAYVAGQRGRIGGTVGRDLHAAGQGLAITGHVVRSIAFSGNGIELAPSARVGGDIAAYVPNDGAVSRAAAAQLASEPQIHKSDGGHKSGGVARASKRWLTPGFYFWQAVRIAAALALGLLLYWLLPALFDWPTPPERRLLRSSGIGFLAFVATPVAAVLLGITVIGLPIGALALGAWVVALYLSGILVALRLGQLLLRSPQRNAGSFALALLTGLALLRITVNLPYLGVLVWFLVVVVGLGLLIAQLVQLARRLRAPAVV
jgi:hypothetical protein